MQPRKVIQAVSSFERDPFSRERKEQEPKELTQEEVNRRNEDYNEALYGGLDSNLSHEDVGRASESEVDGFIDIQDNSSLENYYSKIENETEGLYQEVLTALSAQGMPESAINDSSRVNIRKRIIAEIDRIAASNQESVDLESIGGSILPNESKIQVIRAVVSEEMMGYYNEAPGEALKELSKDAVVEMYGHNPSSAPEMRSTENLALYGSEVEGLSGQETVEEEVERALTEMAEEAVGTVESEPKSELVDNARDEVLDIYEELGGDLSAKAQEVGLGDIDQISIDRDMITPGGDSQSGEISSQALSSSLQSQENYPYRDSSTQ